MAPPLFHRRPQARALRAPGRTATQLVRARQRSALAFAGGGGGLQALPQAEVLQQASDGAGGGADLPVPRRRTFVRLRQDVPQALQAGPHWPLLYGADVTLLTPAARLCSE